VESATVRTPLQFEQLEDIRLCQLGGGDDGEHDLQSLHPCRLDCRCHRSPGYGRQMKDVVVPLAFERQFRSSEEVLVIQ
jgi:hypothetical protein